MSGGSGKKTYGNTVRYCTVFLALLLLFCLAIIWNVNTGSVHISVPQIINIIFRADATDQASFNIIWRIRLPRMLLAALLGGALSLADRRAARPK